jgi:hypothetical protein
LELPEDAIHIDNMFDDCILSAYVEGDGHVMVITTVDDEYRSVWLYTDKMQNYCYSGKDLTEIVKEMIEDGLEVFQFDDEAEFSIWLQELFGPDDKPKKDDVKPPVGLKGPFTEAEVEAGNSRP